MTALPAAPETARPRILFLHLSGPAQFEFLGAWLARHGWDVTFAHGGDASDTQIDGIRTRRFRLRETLHPRHDLRHVLDHAAMNCLGATDLLFRMRHDEGYRPDVVMAHVGWGVGLSVKQVWPDCRYIAYHEWYYTHRNWDKQRAEAPVDAATLVGDRMRNLPITAVRPCRRELVPDPVPGQPLSPQAAPASAGDS